MSGGEASRTTSASAQRRVPSRGRKRQRHSPAKNRAVTNLNSFISDAFLVLVEAMKSGGHDASCTVDESAIICREREFSSFLLSAIKRGVN